MSDVAHEDVLEVLYVDVRNYQEMSIRVRHVDLIILDIQLEVILELGDSMSWNERQGFKGGDFTSLF